MIVHGFVNARTVSEGPCTYFGIGLRESGRPREYADRPKTRYKAFRHCARILQSMHDHRFKEAWL